MQLSRVYRHRLPAGIAHSAHPARLPCIAHCLVKPNRAPLRRSCSDGIDVQFFVSQTPDAIF